MCAGADGLEEERPFTQGRAGVMHDLRILAAHPLYMFAMLAACPSSGVFGALSYWGPHVSAHVAADVESDRACTGYAHNLEP